MQESDPLISIKKISFKNRKSLTILGKIAAGPIADKCFLASALGSILGILYLGVSLWLIRQGVMAPSEQYGSLRELHAFQQMFFFFGFAILGFALQSAPRFLELASSLPFILRFGPVTLMLLAWCLLYIETNHQISSLLICISFSTVALYLLFQIVWFKRPTPPLLLLLSSLLTFAIAPFINIEVPDRALFIFWLAIGAPLLGFSQIFIGNLLGGRRLSRNENFLLLFLYLITFLGAVFSITLSEPNIVRATSGFILLTLIYYVANTKLINHTTSKFPHLKIAFQFGYLWAFIGACLSTIYPSNSDAAFHIWATGWGTIILIAMTSHIIGFLSGSEASQKNLIRLVYIWQVVPIGRGLSDMIGLPHGFSIATGIAAGIVLIGWTSILISAERRILIRQYNVTASQPMILEA